MKKFIFFTVLIAFALCLCVGATNKISPAVDVIAYESGMVKSGVTYNGELYFDVNDFDRALMTNVKSITVSKLPDEKSGKLMLGTLYVVENQVIYRDELSELKFIPSSSESGICSFCFEPNESPYEIECSLKTLQTNNFSPVASNGISLSTWTQEDISCYGSLNGYDPEGDKLLYEIVSYPEKGLVMLTNDSTGDYKYTPYMKAKGTDTFSYRVRDNNGNFSEVTTVKVKIDKLKTALTFSDMENNKNLNAVLVVSSMGLMEYDIKDNGELCFNPDEYVTKEEFVALVMDAMGAKDVPVVDKTRFADDDMISPEYKGYAECAFSLGIVKEKPKDDGIHYEPKSKITVSEAAVIINNIIGAKSNSTTTVFKDQNEIPDSAKNAITSLNELGIIPKSEGKVNPNSTLTRAQTAHILMSLLEYRGKVDHK